MNTTQVLGEMSIRRRASKLARFLQSSPPDAPRITPRPWDEPSAPYQIITSLDNSDGHGGYTRLNRFDDDGVPYKIDGARRRYHPLVVSGYALKMLAIAAITGESEPAARARRMLPPLIASARRTGAWGAGPSPESMISESAHSNVQGTVISALLRLAGGRPEGEIAGVLDRAVLRLLEPAERGGAMDRLAEGPFLQEAPGTPIRHILNGCLVGLFGLYDMADAAGHPEAGRSAGAIERTLIRSIDMFHAPGGWSYYALDAWGRPYLASLHYHWCAIAQVRIVAARTQAAPLFEATAIWERALRSTPRRLRAGVAKLAQVLWMRDIRRLPLDVCP